MAIIESGHGDRDEDEKILEPAKKSWMEVKYLIYDLLIN